jgi:hypothetical protein
MERMLELPVNSEGPEAKSLASAEPVLSEPAEVSPFAEFSPLGIPSYQTGESDASAADMIPPSNGQSPFRFAEPTSIAANGGTGNRIVVSGTSTHVADDGPPPPVWLWPVVGINKIYDALMDGLGSPGRIMRRTGRAWLGWIGLLMLAAALAWGVLDWLQWAG